MSNAQPETKPAAQPMVCPECGYTGKPMMVEGQPSCPKCGCDMQPAEGSAQPADGTASKAGRRHSKSDMDLLTEIRVSARSIDAAAVALGAEEAADAEVEPSDGSEQPMPPGANAKTRNAPASADAPLIWGAVKAAGDWALDVLGVPYGGPNGGKDAHGEFFTARTNLHLDKFTPIPVYYHGFTPDGKPQGEPEIIGKVEKVEPKKDGVWYRVVLNQASDYAKRVWAGAQKGIARASSGTIAHLRRVAPSGEILNWPVVEISLFDAVGDRQPANAYAVALPAAKARFNRAGIPLTITDAATNAKGEQQRGGEASQPSEEIDMDEKTMQELVANAVKAELAGQAKAAAEKAAQDAAIKAEVEKGIAAAKAEWAKTNRLPDGGNAPTATKFGWMKKYERMEPRDLALLIDVLTPNKHLSEEKDLGRAPAGAVKALAVMLDSDEAKRGQSEVGGVKVDNALLYREAIDAVKAMTAEKGIKANELDNTAQSGYGSDWVGTAYSTNLWEVIRQDVSIGKRLMDRAIEIPQGYSSIYLPVEGADPTWYKIAETTAKNATTGIPDSSVTDSKVATANKQLTVAKMGARVMWSGEMEEDSLLPFVANLRRQLEVSALEQFTHAVIDGDTATGATTNINHIGGTPTATDLYLLMDGFRKAPLVTTTANSRSAAGSLVVDDFLKTIQLMGTAGKNALVNRESVAFIVDLNTYWTALKLPEIKTRDVFAQPTIEQGQLTGLFGYSLIASAFMHYKSAALKANTAGKVDQTTPNNNTTGSILAVRFDQWQLGFKRRIAVETQRIPAADATQIVATMRVGMVNRDTAAATITYNVGLS